MILVFVRPITKGNFILYVTHPDVHKQMQKGFFAKTSKNFSGIALDQAHEQNNKIIKGVGGATSLSKSRNDSALIRWETCGPQVARIVSDFEDVMDEREHSGGSNKSKHHEDNRKFQTRFNYDVETVYQLIPIKFIEVEAFNKLNNSSPLP